MVLARDIMLKDVPYVHPSDAVTKARAMIRKQNKRVLPVLDDGKIVGILTRGDVMRFTATKTNTEVRDIMNTHLTSVTSTDDVFAVIKKMVKTGIRQIPVISDGKFEGMITATSILTEIVEKGYKPTKKTIGAFMTKDVIMADYDEDVSKIWNTMLSTGLTGIPVVKKGKVAGFISRRDLILAGYARPKGKNKNKSVEVNKIMRSSIVTATEDASTEEVSQIMVTKNVVRVPVVESKNSLKLVGIVDILDILGAYI